jgi:hypothetical protein
LSNTDARATNRRTSLPDAGLTAIPILPATVVSDAYQAARFRDDPIRIRHVEFFERGTERHR